MFRERIYAEGKSIVINKPKKYRESEETVNPGWRDIFGKTLQTLRCGGHELLCMNDSLDDNEMDWLLI